MRPETEREMQLVNQAFRRAADIALHPSSAENPGPYGSPDRAALITRNKILAEITSHSKEQSE